MIGSAALTYRGSTLLSVGVEMPWYLMCLTRQVRRDDSFAHEHSHMLKRGKRHPRGVNHTTCSTPELSFVYERKVRGAGGDGKMSFGSVMVP